MEKMKLRCQNCGTEIAENYTFCINCGSEVRDLSTHLNQNNFNYKEASRLAYKRSLRNRKIIILGGVVFFIIVIGVLIPLGVNWLRGEYNFEYAGTVNYSVSKELNVSKLSLDINNYRSINLSMEPNLANHFQVKINIFARNGYNEQDIDTFKESVFNEELMLTFEPKNFWSEFSSPKYQYEMQISISSGLEVGLNIHCSYGNIVLLSNSSYIDHLFLDSSFGNVTALFTNTLFGGDNETFNGLDSTFGYIEANFINSSFNYNETRFSLYSMEKGVDLLVEQKISDKDSFRYVEYYLEADTIFCSYQISSDIGVGIETTASPENIHISGLLSQVDFPYYRDNFLTSPLRFLFDLHCFNGSVYISEH